MTTILVTLLFLLSDGTPAKDATVICAGVEVFTAGDDAQAPVDGSTPLIVDSRGAVLLQAKPTTITCNARWNAWYFSGPIDLKTHGQVTRLYLEKDS